MPSHKTGPHRDMEQSIAQSAAGLIRLLGENAEAEANLVAARYAELNDVEAEKTWRAIVQVIRQRRSQTKSAITGHAA